MKYEKMKPCSYKELKEEFIKHFGIEKWKEEKILGKLATVMLEEAEKLGIDILPIIYEDIEEDSRLYLKEDYICINEKFSNNYIESLKCLLYHLRQTYQFVYIRNNDNKKSSRWKEEYQAKEENAPLTFGELELDAYCYMQEFVKKVTKKTITYPDEETQKAINLYKESIFKLY